MCKGKVFLNLYAFSSYNEEKELVYMLKDLVVKNRSYRSFDETCKVSKDELMEMVDCARLCPSSVNLQPLKYYLAFEEAEVAKIQALTSWAKALPITLPRPGHCPTAFIIICQDMEITMGVNSCLKDVGIVAQTILLKAVEMDLGGCMIGSFQKEQLHVVLALPETWQPVLVLAIGKPVESIVLTEVKEDGDIRYYRDEQDVHYVPKRALEDIILQSRTSSSK